MTIVMRTAEEIKAGLEHLKSMRRLREDAAAVVANGDVDEAAKRLFLVRYGRPYDVTDSGDSDTQLWELEACRSLVKNPLLLYEREYDEFARIVALVAAPGPERDARAAERAIRDGLAMPVDISRSNVLRAVHAIPKHETDPWAEFDGEHWELGPDEQFQADPVDLRPGRPVDDGFGWVEAFPSLTKRGVG